MNALKKDVEVEVENSVFGMTPKKVVFSSTDDSMTLNFKLTVRKDWGAEWQRVMGLLSDHYDGGGTAVVQHLIETNFDALKRRAEALPRIVKTSKSVGGAA